MSFAACCALAYAAPFTHSLFKYAIPRIPAQYKVDKCRPLAVHKDSSRTRSIRPSQSQRLVWRQGSTSKHRIDRTRSAWRSQWLEARMRVASASRQRRRPIGEIVNNDNVCPVARTQPCVPTVVAILRGLNHSCRALTRGRPLLFTPIM